MVNANELRVGNKLLFNGAYVSISTIEVYENGSFLSFVINDGRNIENCPISEYEPIPLTDEILESAGFKHKNINEYRLGSIRIIEDFSEKRFLTYTHTMHMTVFQCLHHLQNWFFFTTGEELEINLTPAKELHQL